ncbi:MAG: TetR/AcrR family transcriptional regulator [Catalinimonas sp.]
MPTLTETPKLRLERKATELFRERGYAATTMRDLARRVGVEAASLYAHVRSKEELLRKICFDMADRFFAALDTAEAPGLAPAEQLRRYVTAHVSVITGHPAPAAVFLHEWRHLSEPSLTDFRALRDRYEERFRAVITAGVEAGAFRAVDPKFTTLTVLSALNWTYQWYRPDGAMSSEQIAAQLYDLLLRGLKEDGSRKTEDGA